MYPVHLEVTPPPRYDRLQLVLRLALAIVLGAVGITTGWLACVLYIALPVVAAIAISTSREVRPQVWRVLSWLLQLDAYMMLLVDRFPTSDREPVHLDAQLTGTPTVGSAFARLLTSIPSALVLSILWFVSGILWIVAAITILVGETVPAGIATLSTRWRAVRQSRTFQAGVLRWNARLVAYHASLVEEYPPFTLHDDAPLAVAP